MSPQIEQLLGFSQKEWLEDPILWYTRLHPEDRDRWHHEFAQTCPSAVPFRSVYRFLARDGRVVWVQGEARLVRDAEGRSLFLQGIAFDITDRKEAEEALHRARRAGESRSGAHRRIGRRQSRSATGLGREGIASQRNPSPGEEQSASNLQPAQLASGDDQGSGHAPRHSRKPKPHQVDGADPRTTLSIAQSAQDSVPSKHAQTHRAPGSVVWHGRLRVGRAGRDVRRIALARHGDPVRAHRHRTRLQQLETQRFRREGRARSSSPCAAGRLVPGRWRSATTESACPRAWNRGNVESLGLQLVNTLATQLEGTLDLCGQGGTTFEIHFREKPGS